MPGVYFFYKTKLNPGQILVSFFLTILRLLIGIPFGEFFLKYRAKKDSLCEITTLGEMCPKNMLISYLKANLYAESLLEISYGGRGPGLGGRRLLLLHRCRCSDDVIGGRVGGRTCSSTPTSSDGDILQTSRRCCKLTARVEQQRESEKLNIRERKFVNA